MRWSSYYSQFILINFQTPNFVFLILEALLCTILEFRPSQSSTIHSDARIIAVGGRWTRWSEKEEGIRAEDKGEANRPREAQGRADTDNHVGDHRGAGRARTPLWTPWEGEENRHGQAQGEAARSSPQQRLNVQSIMAMCMCV